MNWGLTLKDFTLNGLIVQKGDTDNFLKIKSLLEAIQQSKP